VDSPAIFKYCRQNDYFLVKNSASHPVLWYMFHDICVRQLTQSVAEFQANLVCWQILQCHSCYCYYYMFYCYLLNCFPVRVCVYVFWYQIWQKKAFIRKVPHTQKMRKTCSLLTVPQQAICMHHKCLYSHFYHSQSEFQTFYPKMTYYVLNLTHSLSSYEFNCILCFEYKLLIHFSMTSTTGKDSSLEKYTMVTNIYNLSAGNNSTSVQTSFVNVLQQKNAQCMFCMVTKFGGRANL